MANVYGERNIQFVFGTFYRSNFSVVFFKNFVFHCSLVDVLAFENIWNTINKNKSGFFPTIITVVQKLVNRTKTVKNVSILNQPCTEIFPNSLMVCCKVRNKLKIYSTNTFSGFKLQWNENWLVSAFEETLLLISFSVLQTFRFMTFFLLDVNETWTFFPQLISLWRITISHTK